MKMVDRKNAVREIVGLITSKARYQKVVFCLDKDSDTETVDKVCELVGRDAVIIKYYYNKKNIYNFFNMINNGVRIVVYDVSLKHFYSLQNNNLFILNVFMPQTNFVLPHINNIDSMYGENLLVSDSRVRDYCSVIFMYMLALDDLWSKLLQGLTVNTDIFKRIDKLVKCDDFYNELVSIFECLKINLTSNYQQLDDEEVCGYVLARCFYVLQMLEMVDAGEERYIDFYKNLKSSKEIDKAYNLIMKYNVVENLRMYSSKLLKIVNVIIDRVKIIINKYLNNKINFKKYNKNIKNEALSLNIDNLLYISYILNCI